MSKTVIIVIIVVVVLVFVIINKGSEKKSNLLLITMGNLVLKSSAFEEGQTIPEKFTCDGEDINSALLIEGAPENAKSLVLIMDDPDATAGVTWDHWILWNIPPETKEISENAVPQGAIEGKTSWNRNEYGGPCPPKGNPPHRYMFKLYALDTRLDLIPSISKGDLEKAMEGHILDQTTLMGLYGR